MFTNCPKCGHSFTSRLPSCPNCANNLVPEAARPKAEAVRVQRMVRALCVGDSVSVLTRRGWIPANVDWIRGDRCRLVSADLKLDMTARCDLVKELRDLQELERGAVATEEKAQNVPVSDGANLK